MIVEIVSSIKRYFNLRALVIPLPLQVLLPIAKLIQAIFGFKNPIHPVRVKKAATPTHIIPQKLIDMHFNFKYDFIQSIKHWQKISPEDFAFIGKTNKVIEPRKLKLVKPADNKTSTGNNIPEVENIRQEETVA